MNTKKFVVTVVNCDALTRHQLNEVLSLRSLLLHGLEFSRAAWVVQRMFTSDPTVHVFMTDDDVRVFKNDMLVLDVTEEIV